MIDIIEIGQILKTRGVHGLLGFRIEEKFENIFEKVKFIFLKINGSKVPFKIEKVVEVANRDFIKLMTIDTPEKASEINNYLIYVAKDQINEDLIESIVSDEPIGYSVFLENGDLVGTVDSIEEYPSHQNLVVNYKLTKILIPYNQLVIKRMSHEEKVIELLYDNSILEM